MMARTSHALFELNFDGNGEELPLQWIFIESLHSGLSFTRRREVDEAKTAGAVCDFIHCHVGIEHSAVAHKQRAKGLVGGRGRQIEHEARAIWDAIGRAAEVQALQSQGVASQ